MLPGVVNGVFNKEDWLKRQKHVVHPDGSVDIHGSVDFRTYDLDEIPFNFDHVFGNFIMHSNPRLKSLKGAPKVVYGSFDIADCGIESLEHLPRLINGNLNAVRNNITSLRHLRKIREYIFLGYNPITSLEYLPDDINPGFIISIGSFSKEDIIKYLRDITYIKTLKADDELPDITSIFD